MEISEVKEMHYQESYGRIRKSLFYFLFILMMILVLQRTFRQELKEGEVRIAFLDVGQGDCIVIYSKDHCYVVDGGGLKKEGDNTGIKILLPFLIEKKIKKIDAAFVTHLHQDHSKGIEEILDKIDIQYLYFSRVYQGHIRDWEESASGCLVYMEQGDRVENSDFYVTCLNSPGAYYDSEEDNHNSLILLFEAHGQKVLLTGDMEEEEERRMLSTYQGDRMLDDIDVLKVAHHGSKTSTTQEFLDRIEAKVAIISVGPNLFSHPNREVLRRLEEKRIDVYLTQDCGMIELTFDSGGFHLND